MASVVLEATKDRYTLPVCPDWTYGPDVGREYGP